MFRLLALLLRQRLHRTRVVTPEGIDGAAAGRRWALMVGLLALVLGVAAYVAVGQWRGRSTEGADLQARAPFERASLRLRVARVESPPLLVFLDMPGADDPKLAQGVQATAQLTSAGSVFEPAFQVALPATRVQMGNADPIAHNTHVFDGGRTLFNVALPVQGLPVTRVLGRAGLFEVRCDLHSWMRAALFVPPNVHYAVMRDAGEFVLRDIAPGSYRLHIWSSARGEQIQTIELLPGATRTIDVAPG
jgi:plastocyanin